MIQRILNLPDSDAYAALADAGKIPEWSRGAIGALVANGISSDSSNLFRPADPATRAEVVAMLDKARKIFEEIYAPRFDSPFAVPAEEGVRVVEGDYVLEPGSREPLPQASCLPDADAARAARETDIE